MSGTSQWPMSDPRTGGAPRRAGWSRRRRPNRRCPRRPRSRSRSDRTGPPGRSAPVTPLSRKSSRSGGGLSLWASIDLLRSGVGEALAAVEIEQPVPLAGIDRARIEPSDAGAAPLLPPTQQVEEQLHTPPDAALEEAEVQVPEAVRHPTEDERLGHGLAARREGADVVEHVAARRLAQVEAHRRRVSGDRHAELGEALPHRVVVVGAVERQQVDPRAARRLGPRDAAVHHRRLEAELDARRARARRWPPRGCGPGSPPPG